MSLAYPNATYPLEVMGEMYLEDSISACKYVDALLVMQGLE
jgi:hypothetical protein